MRVKTSPYICVQCGTQFSESPRPPDSCPVCQDERQFVRWEGQAWTTPAELRASHRVRMEDDGGFLGLGTDPSFAIGQRALLVPSGSSNLLWDCIPLVTPRAVAEMGNRGGVRAMAVSHPHYYSAMVDWSEALGGVPVYLHADDREWVMRPHDALEFWEGEELDLGDGLTLHRLGGHFPGGTVLHHAGAEEGKGALFTGDIVQVVKDRAWVSFMYSYPNLIPLPASIVEGMAHKLRGLAFESLHGAWWGHNVLEDAGAAVQRSAQRYIRALEAPPYPSSSNLFTARRKVGAG